MINFLEWIIISCFDKLTYWGYNVYSRTLIMVWGLMFKVIEIRLTNENHVVRIDDGLG